MGKIDKSSAKEYLLRQIHALAFCNYATGLRVNLESSDDDITVALIRNNEKLSIGSLQWDESKGHWKGNAKNLSSDEESIIVKISQKALELICDTNCATLPPGENVVSKAKEIIKSIKKQEAVSTKQNRHEEADL